MYNIVCEQNINSEESEQHISIFQQLATQNPTWDILEHTNPLK